MAEKEQSLALLLGAGADASALSAYLDSLDGEGRVREIRSLPGALMSVLYERCEKAPPATLAEFMPDSVPVGQTVIYAGLNNLPLFRKFEKRFVRTKSGIWGFNFQTMSPFTGPGYFATTEAKGEILFDYTKVPADQSEMPKDWPKIQPNNRGLSHVIYKNMHDFCRRVSSDVVIGHATRLGKSMPQYFVLARRP